MKNRKAPEEPGKQGTDPEGSEAPTDSLSGNDAEVLEAQPIGDGEAIDVPGEEEGCDRPSVEEELRQELQKTSDRYLRLAADFDNFRKRQVKERQDIVAFANESLVLDILPVLDNLERALTASGVSREMSGGMAGVVKGIELTMRMFQQTLTRNGVERILAVGQKFDPHRHEAIAQVPADGVEPETITEEAEAGYTLSGRVIRPAKVKVARPPAPAPREETEKAKEETDA